MKKIAFTTVAILVFFTIHAQVVLDHKYNFSASVVELETFGYKYFLMDVPTAQCRIYNLDHSVYKTINCSVPSGCYLADVKFISEKLFDTDAGLELAYTWYKYVPTSSSYYYEYDGRVINEDGSELQFMDGALYLYINKVAEKTYKLFAYCFDYSVSPEKVWTNIYSLPGTTVSARIVGENKPEVLLDAYPNPAAEMVKLVYSLPENINEGTLHLLDNTGRAVNRFTIDQHTDFLELNIAQLNSGVYHYFIEYGTARTISKKLVIR